MDAAIKSRHDAGGRRKELFILFVCIRVYSWLKQNMTDYDYDLFVIGAGSGGVRAARIAAGHGAKVAVAEASDLGGTCVNLGCVPKKLFAYGADFGPALDDAKGFGWNMDNISHDWQTLRDNKDQEIKRLNGIYKNLLDRAGVDIIHGFATFEDAHTIKVGDKTYTAAYIMIAVGGRPRQPTFPGNEHVIVSDDAFHLEKLPKKILIQGGGYVSVEFAHIFHGLGVHVDLIYRDTIFLKGFDADIREFLADEMRKAGCVTHFSCDIDMVEKTDTGYHVTCNDGAEIDTDMVFSAIGRIPNTDKINIEAAGVKLQANGNIAVNDHFQTNVPHIYAVGDIINEWTLTPVAIAEGHAVADNLFSGNEKRTVEYDNIATAVFSQPPIGTVGLDEQAAREQYHDKIRIFKTAFRPLKHTLTGRDEKTFMKLVVCAKTGKVLGVHMCGADAPEILQGMAIALKCGATKEDFDRTIGIHPTSAEEFVTMREEFKSD